MTQLPVINVFKKSKFWLAVSILVAVLFSLSGFGLSLGDYVIQDDARQHVFWLQRFGDRHLFPNDLIADYFSSVAPGGYKFVYWLANLLGIEPLVFNKILPLLLGFGTSVYFFLVTTAIFPVPLAGFCGCLLLNQNLWMLDDLVSGTPRAFLYLLFLGFIYHLLQQQLLPCLLFIVLQGFFYPQIVLIAAGVLSLNLLTSKQNRYISLVGLIAAMITVGLYRLQATEFSEVITVVTARQLPEFQPTGRSAFFRDRPWHYWLVAKQTGFFPFEWQYFLLCSFGFFLPIMAQFPSVFPLLKELNPKAKIIWQILIASSGWYILSHLMLFRLHLPGRYSQHTWRITIALLAGIVLTVLLHKLMITIPLSYPGQIMIMAIAICVILYPTYAVQNYPQRLGYVTAKSPELYHFLQQQPKNIMIATLSQEADFIPSFARRTVLTAREYSIPYHWDYYGQIRQRTQDLIQAQYSPNSEDLRQVIEQYHIDYWLLDSNALTPEYLIQNDWLVQFQPETSMAIANLTQPAQLAIRSKIQPCSVFSNTNLHLLDSKCLLADEHSN
ncbi:MAG: hypothetical protein AAF652_11895 [Cyanobacteria bacterium P01_C01_bin.72]